MHRYKNQDHSMLSARLAAQAITAGSHEKAAIWAVNIDDDDHEDAAGKQAPPPRQDHGFAPSTLDVSVGA